MTEPDHNTPISYRTATAEDAAIVARLINSAYRGESSKAGWTTEADLIVGDRISPDGVRGLIAAPHSVVLLCEQGDKIIGCVHLKKTADAAAYLGLFVVQPTLQGQGIGKQFMEYAEQYAKDSWDVKSIWMTVVTLRNELIAYYERRGYRRTGNTHPFPKDAGASVPVIEGLQMETLEKSLTSSTPGTV